MNIGLVVPGGVDASGEYRVIPALLALIRRLALRHNVRVFTLHQGEQLARWDLFGARVLNVGARNTRVRCIRALCAEHRSCAFDVIHAVWSGSPGLVAVAAARIIGVPSVVHVAGGELVALPGIAYGGRLTWKGRLREAVVLRTANQVTAASGAMIASLAALGIAARRIPLGVDLDLWPPRAPVRRSARAPARLIHVASLNRVKDQPTLLRALAALREAGIDFTMNLVGEDTLNGEIQALAQRLGLSTRVRFHGFLPQSRLRPLLEASDVIIISSCHEAGPLVLHEAALVGVPAVGTAVGQIADWAPQAALCAPIGDSVTLARQTMALLSDEELRLSTAHAAGILARRENADYTARSFEQLYANLTSRS